MASSQFHIQRKAFSLNGKYIITNEHDQEAFIAEGKAFSFNNHTDVFNSFGELLYEFKKKPFSWKTTYFILKDGQPAFKFFKRKATLTREIFVESLTDTDAFYIEGNFLGYEYDFYREEKLFASVRKQVPSLLGSYKVSIEDGQDIGLILTTVLIIDRMKISKKKK